MIKKAAFKELYHKMHGLPLREMDKSIDTVCALCREQERVGFVDGVKVGARLENE